MILSSEIRRVLCFGDSNTWGQNDDKNYAGRYPLDIRWPGRIQSKLGSEFEVYEEGLGGRNTNFDHYNPKKSTKNGLAYFGPFIQSHDPFELIILMLGTNDLKVQYNKTPKDIAYALQDYIQLICESSVGTKILIVSPIYINDRAPKFQQYYDGVYNFESAQKSLQLADSLKHMAERYNVEFLDAARVADSGKDGIHLTAQGHISLSDSINSQISEILK